MPWLCLGTWTNIFWKCRWVELLAFLIRHRLVSQILLSRRHMLPPLMQLGDAMAAVYTLGVLNGTWVHHNLLHDVYAWYTGGYCLSQDQGSSHILFEASDLCEVPGRKGWVGLGRASTPKHFLLFLLPRLHSCTNEFAHLLFYRTTSVTALRVHRRHSTTALETCTETTYFPPLATTPGRCRTRLASAVYGATSRRNVSGACLQAPALLLHVGCFVPTPFSLFISPGARGYIADELQLYQQSGVRHQRKLLSLRGRLRHARDLWRCARLPL